METRPRSESDDVSEEPEPFTIEDTCCGRCPGATCYVDYLTGERA